MPGQTYTRAALNGIASAISSQIGANRVVINAAISLLVRSGAIPGDTESIEKTAQQLMNQAMSSNAPGAGESLLTFKINNVGDVEAGNPSDLLYPAIL